MSKVWLDVIGGYVGFGSFIGLMRSEGDPWRIVAVLALAAATVATAMEVHVWLLSDRGRQP